MTGKFRFKTEEQLLASGWVKDEIGYLSCPGASHLIVHSMEKFFGKWIEVDHGVLHPEGWGIDPEMVVGEREIAEELLNRYDKEIEG
jgi:hypothetical protein